eukprot:1878144-Pyramimonas_sp.AAC.1
MHMFSQVLHSGEFQKAPPSLMRKTACVAISMPGSVHMSSLPWLVFLARGAAWCTVGVAVVVAVAAAVAVAVAVVALAARAARRGGGSKDDARLSAHGA